MPTTAFGGQSQQRWPADTLNKHNVMQDLVLTDLTGEPRLTANARRAGLLALASVSYTHLTLPTICSV